MRKLFSIKGIKNEFESKGIKIGKIALEKFIKLQQDKIGLDIEAAARKARISGRKIVKESDFED